MDVHEQLIYDVFMDEKNVFSQMDFGPLTEFLEDDDVTDISYSNTEFVFQIQQY